MPGGASELALCAEIRRAKGDDALAPVFVVVRSPVVGLSLRRRLAADGAFAAVRFASFGALAHRIATHADGGAGLRAGTAPRRPLTEVALRSAARVALERRPGVFAPVAGHSAMHAGLAATYRDLRHWSASELDELAGEGARSGDVVALLGDMRRLLAPGSCDAVDLLEAADARLEGAEEGGDVLDEVGSVLLYLPDPLGLEEIALARQLSGRLDVVALVGRTGDEAADRASDELADHLATAFRTPAAPAAFPALPAVRRLDGVLSAPDEDVEVREAVRRLLAHAEAGGDLGRCVVTYPDGDHAVELAHRITQQLEAAGIDVYGGPSRCLADTAGGALLLRLVALASPRPPGQELDRGEVVSLLASGPLRVGHGLTAGLASVRSAGEIPIGAWDRASREAGVLEGLDQWRVRMQARIDALAARADERAARRAAESADLLEVVERLARLASGASSAGTWAALRAWASGALEDLLEPGGERDLLAEALASFEGLDEIEPLAGRSAGDRLRRFASTLATALERPAGGRGRFGTGPAVGPLSALAGVSADLLIVLGCREGDLPGRDRQDPLVAERERRLSSAVNGAERADERSRRHLLWCLSGASSSQASFARVDVRAGRRAYPSRWTTELFSGRVTEVTSFAGSLRRAAAGATPADLTDFELVSLSALAAGTPSFLESLDGDYARRRRAAAERRLGSLNPFAGYVPAAGGTEEAWAEPLSATGLETFASCPFRFFLERRIGVRCLDPPERIVVMDPRDRGTLMHEVLERFFGESLGSSPPKVLDEAARRRLREIAAEEFGLVEQQGKTGKELFWSTERARILRDLEHYVERDLANSRIFGRVPVRVELGFGGDDHPFEIDVAGRRLLLRGRIDRVDRTGDGRLVVVDYKSGRADKFQSIFTDPLGRGRHLQLPIYAKAALHVLAAEGAPDAAAPPPGPPRAEYRFVQAAAAYAVVPVELTDELEAELREVLTTLVATIDAGAFPLRPGPPVFGSFENCRYCDFDALCPNDRTETWERASTDIEMKSYCELVGEHVAG